ncbi:MAG: hypothetical protein HGA87_02990 [Desulfobulbaceae bacterium]|nr:hypothetical protein [Desulfobulbaceae bacterium]
MPAKPALSRFRKLVDDIARLYSSAKKAQIRFAWDTGRRIVEEEQDGALRAAYGAGLIKKLSEALIEDQGQGEGFSERNLARMKQFYLANPILPHAAKLTWSDHAELLSVGDAKARLRLERKIAGKGLSRKAIRGLVRQQASDGKSARDLPPLTRPAKLKLNTVKPVELCGRSFLDCGFFVLQPTSGKNPAGVTVTDTPSYTYAAVVERFVDGDTLVALIDTGFGSVVRERLRLRGVNCPELDTDEGQKAARFVAGLLGPGSPVVVRSHKTDDYGRFVADVFYGEEDSSPEDIISDGVYLNQELLDEGHAVRMEE